MQIEGEIQSVEHMEEEKSNHMQQERDGISITTEIVTEQTRLSSCTNEDDQANSQNGVLVRKKRIYKKKFKDVVFGYKMILKQSTLNLYEQQQQLEQFIFRQVPTQKVYFVAGDILVELKGNDDMESIAIFNEFRNILNVERSKEALTFEVESVRPLKYLSEIIYYLENSQDQRCYDFAQSLKQHQQTVNLVQEQVTQLKQDYLSSTIDLSDLINRRRKFALEEKRKFIQERVSLDDFCCVGMIQINYENNTSTLSSMCLAKPTVALMGADEEEIAMHFLRKGFIKIFNHNSRRRIFENNMKFQFMRRPEYEVTIPDFEITTMDNIKIVCECKMRTVQIQYPQHLQFQGEQYSVVNSFDQLIYIRYFITPQHLESIIQIRSQYEGQSPQSKQFPDNYDYKQNVEIENFEYCMQCQIFLEKYYQRVLEELKEKEQIKEKQLLEKQALLLEQQKMQEQIPCGYRFIS